MKISDWTRCDARQAKAVRGRPDMEPCVALAHERGSQLSAPKCEDAANRDPVVGVRHPLIGVIERGNCR